MGAAVVGTELAKGATREPRSTAMVAATVPTAPMVPLVPDGTEDRLDSQALARWCSAGIPVPNLVLVIGPLLVLAVDFETPCTAVVRTSF
jgi:hypothetical protein